MNWYSVEKQWKYFIILGLGNKPNVYEMGKLTIPLNRKYLVLRQLVFSKPSATNVPIIEHPGAFPWLHLCEITPAKHETKPNAKPLLLCGTHRISPGMLKCWLWEMVRAQNLLLWEKGKDDSSNPWRRDEVEWELCRSTFAIFAFRSCIA